MVQFLYTSTLVMAQAQAPGAEELFPTTVMIGQANETVIPNDNSGDYGPLDLDVGQSVKISGQNAGLGTILILIGLVQVFFGFKFIRLTLILTGFISWAVIAMVIMVRIRWDMLYVAFKPSHYVFWVWLMSGLVGGILSFRYWNLGVTFAGAFGGFAVAMGIIAVTSNSMGAVGRYVFLAIEILLGAAAATFYERFFIIVSTSCGGAYLFMYGVDEFVQVGYREMLVILDITGKSLVYHPDKNVYIMIGCSLVLALIGMAWEFWHHSRPVMMGRKALFRIYGRPFGKRPEKLLGQRIRYNVSKMDWYTYLTGCACFWRKNKEDVFIEEDENETKPPALYVPPPGRPSGSKSSRSSRSSKKSQSTIEVVVVGGESGVSTSSATASCSDHEEVKEDEDKHKPTSSAILQVEINDIHVIKESSMTHTESHSSETTVSHSATMSHNSSSLAVSTSESGIVTSSTASATGTRTTTTTSTHAATTSAHSAMTSTQSRTVMSTTTSTLHTSSSEADTVVVTIEEMTIA
ncbi:hypothetical protein BG005_003863 [Podila minutissima]|nr:hypothetical protein BG005_003863 [Podila minutissima]